MVILILYPYNILNIKHFEIKSMPHFLDGPVCWFKLKWQDINYKEMYRRIKESDLYDEKLKMYKVNASLSNVTFEVGRATAFTPGWLENESI